MVVPTNILSLFTGLGGLDLGVEIALPGSRVVCAVERDAYCAALLAQRMEQGVLPQAPVWSDVRTFVPCSWVGVVDVLTAGYPCQGFSVAGNRRGADDPRYLWPEVRRVIEECHPRLVFLENVARHLNVGFDLVARELQGLGYTVAALVCRAATVGAPHQRERLFALGISNTGRECLRNIAERIQLNATEHWNAQPRDMGDEAVGDGDGSRLQGYEEGRVHFDKTGRDLDRPSGAPSSVGHADGECGDEGAELREQARSGLDQPSPWPPGPADAEGWAGVPEILWPSAQPEVRRVVDGLPCGLGFRRAQLHALGNAVVPLQAAYAFATLVFALNEEVHRA